MLGLQARLESSPQHTGVLAVVARVAQRLSEERDQLRVSSRIEATRMSELAWAMSQGILAMTALGPARETDLTRAHELRDSACRWILDSLSG